MPMGFSGRLATALFVVAALSIGIGAHAAGEHEKSVCSGEGLFVLILKLIAGSPKDLLPENASHRRIELDSLLSGSRQCFDLWDEQFTTSDDRILRGYRLATCDQSVRDGKTAVLVAHGNAMLADQTIAYLPPIAALGMDVIVFDYRGYGRSGGTSRLSAVSQDYKELIEKYRKDYDRLVGYGASIGGLLLLKSGNRGQMFDHLILDSVPDRIDALTCPKAYDPVENVPADASNISLIYGGKDTTVRTRDLPRLLQDKGATVIFREDFAHVFQDSYSVAKERWRIVSDLVRESLARAEEKPGD